MERRRKKSHRKDHAKLIEPSLRPKSGEIPRLGLPMRKWAWEGGGDKSVIGDIYITKNKLGIKS